MAMPDRVKILAPQGAIAPTGTWSPGARARDFVFIAGMRGIDPANDRLVEGEEARIRQAFMNMKFVAESEGANPYGLRAFDRFRDRYESFEAVRIRRAPLSRSPRLTRTTFSRWKAPSIHQKANEFTNALGLAVFYRIHISVNETAAPSNRMEFHGH